MIQDELRIQTTKCDNCIIGTMIVLECEWEEGRGVKFALLCEEIPPYM
jgi:hypothetical protein